MSSLVYQAVNAVIGELAHAGIGKNHTNEQGGYTYRSIDDVMAALAPLLAKHKLCVLPRILERQAMRHGRQGVLISVRAAFDLVSAHDGSFHTLESFGEALDEGDKATAKATSAAYKTAMLQAFCIPVPQEEADAFTPRLNSARSQLAIAEPPEGWDNWAEETVAIVKSCETPEAVERLMASRRQCLAALQRSRADLYAEIGDAITLTLSSAQNSSATKPSSKAKSRARKQKERGSEALAAAEPA